MKIHLHSVYRAHNPEAPSRIDYLRRCAAACSVKQHSLTDDPAAADAILVTEAWRHMDGPFYRAILHDEIVRAHRAKAFSYCEMDHPSRVLPGLYPSVPRWTLDPQFHVPCPYIIPTRETFETGRREVSPTKLFSFRGSAEAHPVRRNICRLTDPRGRVEDVTREWTAKHYRAGHDEMINEYVTSLLDSKFILCPRGKGASSMRLFEAMAIGRVPVIISDSWSKPPGVDWSACAVRIPESRVLQIPQILSEMEPQWPAMQAAAMRAYDASFATGSIFNWIGTQLEGLVRQPRASAGRRGVSIGASYLAQLREEANFLAKHLMGGFRGKAAAPS